MWPLRYHGLNIPKTATGIQPHINKISEVYEERLLAERRVFVVNGSPEVHLARDFRHQSYSNVAI